MSWNIQNAEGKDGLFERQGGFAPLFPSIDCTRSVENERLFAYTAERLDNGILPGRAIVFHSTEDKAGGVAIHAFGIHPPLEGYKQQEALQAVEQILDQLAQ